jgi:hypothetical protein
MIKLISEYIIVGMDIKTIKVNIIEDSATTNIERNIANLAKELINEQSKYLIKNDVSTDISAICNKIGK